MIRDACFEVLKLEDSILNFQILFKGEKNVTTYKKNMFMVCGTKSERYCTDLEAYARKRQQVSVNAKCYNKEIQSPNYLSGSNYQLNFWIHLLIW